MLNSSITTLAARALRCLDLDVRAFHRARDLETRHADAAPIFPALDQLAQDQQTAALTAWAADVEAYEVRTGIDAAGRLADRARRRAAEALRRLADAEISTLADLLVVAAVANRLGELGEHADALAELHDAVACGGRTLARAA